MEETLKEIGDLLRRRRTERGLSLKEIENATSIRSTYLQAVEDGKVLSMLSPIYAQGFIRQYASFLGIDGDSIIRKHPEIFLKREKHEFDYGIGTLEMRGSPGSGVRWAPNAVWIGAFVLLAATAYYIAKLLDLI